MSIDWNGPLFVAGTDRPAVVTGPAQSFTDRLLGRRPYKFWVRADWKGDGSQGSTIIDPTVASSVRRVSNASTYVPPAPVVDPRSAEADELLAQFYESEGGNGAAAQARRGDLRDNQIHRLILFMLNRSAG
jgi:hypothetical protein